MSRITMVQWHHLGIWDSGLARYSITYADAVLVNTAGFHVHITADRENSSSLTLLRYPGHHAVQPAARTVNL
jgi:hypothetical protein